MTVIVTNIASLQRVKDMAICLSKGIVDCSINCLHDSYIIYGNLHYRNENNQSRRSSYMGTYINRTLNSCDQRQVCGPGFCCTVRSSLDPGA